MTVSTGRIGRLRVTVTVVIALILAVVGWILRAHTCCCCW
jgi:uncharacterized membrane protein